MNNPYMSKALSAYAAANSAVPPLLGVVRLYEKALTHLHKARSALLERRYEPFFRDIERAITIFAGLDSIIDVKIGSDVAIELRRFYASMMGQAGVVAARKDPVVAIDSLIRQWAHMLDVWRAIAAERSGTFNASGASVKGPPASAIGSPLDHAYGRILL